MQARYPYCEKICRSGQELVANRHESSGDIQSRIKVLNNMWQRLRDLAKQRKTRLEDAAESHQVSHSTVFEHC